MKFNLNDKTQISKYRQLLGRRVNYIKNKVAEDLWANLYTTTPRATGAAAASWNISLNQPDYTFDINKTSNVYIDLNCNLNDEIIIATGCPYMLKLNNRLFIKSTY